jgi:crotonobetainyl-CoA:carnitine CoA-transferase CaiB-like acyl-CoA transferase
MFDGVSAFIAPHMARHLAGQEEPVGPGTMDLNGRFPCYRTYRAADGRWMALAALEPKFWAAFCALVGRPDLVARQFEDSAAMTAEVTALFASRTRQEWEELSQGADVMLEPVNSLAEAAVHPQTRARGLLVEVGGEIPQPAPVVRFPEGYVADAAVAAPGADTDDVLAALGYGRDEIEALHLKGVLGTA